MECVRTNGGVCAAEDTQAKCPVTDCSIAEASFVTTKRGNTHSRVADTFCVIKECLKTDSRIAAANGVHSQRTSTGSRVLFACFVVTERIITSGRVAVSVVVTERTITDSRVEGTGCIRSECFEPSRRVVDALCN